MLNGLRAFLWLLSRSRLGMLGAIVTTTGFVVELTALAWGHFAHVENPYLGMVTFAIMPGVIGGGLALIPVGLLWTARKVGGGRLDLTLVKRLAGATSWEFATRLGMIVSLATLLNVSFFTTTAYEGYHYMDSREFCGLVCHQVMEPEYTTNGLSPHASVECVECHIGPGADFFVKAKISGAWQMVAVAADIYPRPIETPVANLRPARDTCEGCHEPDLFKGNRVDVVKHYAEDEQNSLRYTVLNMRIGGGEDLGHPTEGIHSHVSERRVVTYEAADHEWNEVVSVTLTDEEEGSRKTWRRVDTIGREVPIAVTRTMDCVDCHNRTAHDFSDPLRALEERMLVGEIDPTIPWIRKEAYELLVVEYHSEEAAAAGFDDLSNRYRARHPEAWAARSADIEKAEAVLLRTWKSFVWPGMNIQWGTYERRDTHDTDRSGCFRCHNDDMVDEAGQPINSQCEACHFVLAEDDPQPEVFECLHRERSVAGLF